MLADYFIVAVTLYAFGAAVPAYDVTRTIHHINRIFLDALNQYRKLRCGNARIVSTRDQGRCAAPALHTLGVSRINLRRITPIHHRNRYSFRTRLRPAMMQLQQGFARVGMGFRCKVAGLQS
jgi:hypothetical protein